MTYTSEEILFAMFILKANNKIGFKNWSSAKKDRNFPRIAKKFYADLFSDRGICEISQYEIDGWIKLKKSLSLITTSAVASGGNWKPLEMYDRD